MASHSELRPDDAALPLLIASAALSKAESRLTVATGTVVADNADGTQTWIGSNGSDDTSGVIRWVGDLSAPGRPLGLSAACSMQCVVVSWDGTLEDGVPSDFAYIEIFARREGNVDDVVSWGRLSSAGMLMSPRYDIGTVFDVYAIAYDDAHDSTGMLARNRSEQSDLITVAVEQDADMEQIDTAVEEMSKKADEAGAKAEQVRKDMQSEVDDVRAKVDGLSSADDRLSGQITDIRGTVNGQQSKLDEFGQKLEGVVTQNGATVNSVTDLRQTVSGLDARVSQNTETAEGAMGKATTLEQTASSLSTKISEHATTLEATVKTANEAKSTADSNKTTISQVSTTASDALSKATSLESGLDGFKTTVSQTYQTKADMSSYSTKTYVDETSKSVALGVVQDYKGADGSGLATKSEVNVSKDNIALAVQGMYEGDDESLKDIQSSLNITRDKVTIAFSNAEAATKVGDRLEAYRNSNDTNVGDLTDRLNAEIAARQSYIQFGQNANNPVMEMGATSSTARMRLTNTQLQFLVGSVIAAYISNDQLYINNANVLQTLRIGKYAFMPRSDGHMSLKYVG